MKFLHYTFSNIQLTLMADDLCLRRVAFGCVEPEGAEEGSCRALTTAREQLDEYLAGRRTVFHLATDAGGTAFQRRVWACLQQIPYGQTISYSELAARVGCPRGARAVAAACHVNPLPIVVPCHRVIGKQGLLTGYAGGLPLKRKLLLLEGVSVVEKGDK